MEKILPIGSVCRLKNGTKKVMVIGYAPQSQKTNEIFDYLGCLYPEGILGSDVNISFNAEQIDEVFYEGLVDDEQKMVSEKVASFLANKNNK